MTDRVMIDNFKLEVPIGAMKQGDTGSITILTIHSPTAKHIGIVSKIHSIIAMAEQKKTKAFMSADIQAAVNEFKNSEEGKKQIQSEREKEKNVGQEVLQMIKEADLFSQFCDLFENLILSKGICEAKHAANDVSLGAQWYNQIDINDLIALMERYLELFFLQSNS